MDILKVMPIWLNYLARGLLGRRRFIGVTPPFSSVQRLYHRPSGKWFTFKIRDDDDWIQIEHIFLNEGFDLAPTARGSHIQGLYDQMIEAGETPLIVDLGANIGLASRYFQHVFPRAAVVAVEPDAGNCAIARHNLPPEAELIEAAVSSHGGTATLIDTGRNCGFQVSPKEGGDVRLVTMKDILGRAHGKTPFLIKIDIEGFEEDLFSSDVEWIDRFPVLLIELHDWMLPNRRVTRNFLSAIASREREFMHFEGYVVSLSSQIFEQASNSQAAQIPTALPSAA